MTEPVHILEPRAPQAVRDATAALTYRWRPALPVVRMCMVVPAHEAALETAPAPVDPEISVVIPAYNAAATLDRVLEALEQSEATRWETIVVDDGSEDETPHIARAHGCTVLRTEAGPGGPARARNLGAAAATAPVVAFIDADVLVQPTTLARLLAPLREDCELIAVFGSYDAEPAAPGMLSQYRNLLHHYVHQTARAEAVTFWAGCGAIRRAEFLACGGFDPSYARPSIEDIELGYRLTAAGKRIQVAKDVQVKHLKRWTLRSIITTDIRDRAIPWSVLIRRSGHLPNDLNLTYSSRVSGASAIALLALLGLGFRKRFAWLLAMGPALALVSCNLRLYRFFFAHRGARFTAAAIALHWLYYAYSTLAYAGVVVRGLLRERAIH